ncbi:MAG: dihydrofolate reductase [Cyclobacteriaceae bacterium]|nr:dihydrofolate reductase [Cyclobacteriaceae bacterium]
MKKISLIAAMSENRVIGRHNQLPWNMPADWQNFRRITAGKPFVMGRNSYLAPDKLLSTSRSIILSHSEIPDLCENCIRAENWETALSLLQHEPEIFILGGQSIFEQAMSFANYIYLTVVHGIFPGDAWFPEIDKLEWKLIKDRFYHRDSRNPYDYSFQEYIRAG